MKKKGKYIECCGCKKTFYRFPSRESKFCSRLCLDSFYAKIRKLNSHKCSECENYFYSRPGEYSRKKHSRKTCSVKCYGLRSTRLAEESRINNPPTLGALNRRLRYSKKMEDWRRAVFERDNYTCQKCEKRGCYLQAHHIKQFAYFPHLRFDLSNGLTLCKKCHKSEPHIKLTKCQKAKLKIK